MEKNHHNDNFERFLRDKTDEFVMYPSKRIWYSIYNNMHPGNRLPSISMCIILMFSLLLAGYLNTADQPGSHPANTSIAKSDSKAQTPLLIANSTALNKVTADNQHSISMLANRNGELTRELPTSQIATTHPAKPLGNSLKDKQIAIATATSSTVNAEPAPVENQRSLQVKASQKIQVSSPGIDDALVTDANTVQAAFKPAVETDMTTNDPVTISANGGKDKLEVNPVGAVGENVVVSAENFQNIAIKSPVVQEKDIKVTRTGLTETEKAWIDHYALYNRPAPKSWAGKLSLLAYVTPSVVFSNLQYNVADKPGLNSNSRVTNGDVNDFVKNKPSIGLETGVSLQYKVSKRLKLKAGVQFNYTRYNTHAFENFHPIATSLTMNNGYPYEVFATTPYSNSFGLSPVKLHNETYQFSLPVGADFRITALDNIEWYAGATIQPTMVLFANSYVISTDRRNFVNEPSLLNRFNLNAGFETYLSYKTNGYTWQAGPQFRSQIFSTNTRSFSVEERLMNYGFKIGVSKRL
jgi:hypothetical protein